MTHISRHVDNDDARHYFFTRDSKLPLGTFPRGRHTADWWVLASCLAGALLAIVATGAV